MTTTLRMSVEFSTGLRLSKMKRSSYAEWKRNEEEAKRRAEEYRRQRNGRCEVRDPGAVGCPAVF